MDAHERWLPVVGFEGQYEVSDFGRVRSLNRTISYQTRCRWSGATLIAHRFCPGKILSPGVCEAGHLNVAIGRGNSKLVHVLVLTAFVGPRPPGQECLHGDGVPSNNRLTNLRWGTRLENVADSYRHNTRVRGERHPASKLTAEMVREIRHIARSLPFAAVARQFGIHPGTVRQIARGETWQHLTDAPDLTSEAA